MTADALSPAQPSLFCPSPRSWQWWGEELSVGCGRRDCEVCGERWARDQRIKLLDAMAVEPGDVALITVTAPGQSVLPWASDGTHTVDQAAAEEWNQSAAQRWRELHRRAQQSAARAAEDWRGTWRISARVWELQRRGVLHLHIVVPFASPSDRAAAAAYLRTLERHRARWGFGFIDKGVLQPSGGAVRTRRLRATPQERAAAYLGGYLSSGEKGGGIRAVARQGVRTGSIVYVNTELSRRSGTTMRSLRGRRSVSARYPWAAESLDSWECARVLVGISRGRPPLARGAVAEFRRAWATERPALVCDAETGLVRPPIDACPPRSAQALTRRPGAARRAMWVVRLDSVWHRDHGSAVPVGRSAIAQLHIRAAPA